MYYGHYDKSGKYVGFYILEIHGDNIPTPNLELTEEEWQQALTGNYRVIDGRHTYSLPTGPTAEEIRQQGLDALDQEYDLQFDAIILAWATASIDGDTETAAARQEDKQTLVAEYQQKREAILHG